MAEIFGLEFSVIQTVFSVLVTVVIVLLVFWIRSVSKSSKVIDIVDDGLISVKVERLVKDVDDLKTICEALIEQVEELENSSGISYSPAT
jgi:uncharacterized protein YsxB (DUF464 family)